MAVGTILLIIALVCFLLATAGFPSGVNLGWFGLALVVLAVLVGKVSLG